MPETTPTTDAMPDRIWVRRDDTALGPFEVSSVADPEGLAAIELGWTEYTATTGGQVPVHLTAQECKALRMAALFGTPTPTPPEIASATAKLAEAEYAISLDGGRDA